MENIVANNLYWKGILDKEKKAINIFVTIYNNLVNEKINVADLRKLEDKYDKGDYDRLHKGLDYDLVNNASKDVIKVYRYISTILWNVNNKHEKIGNLILSEILHFIDTGRVNFKLQDFKHTDFIVARDWAKRNRKLYFKGV